MVGPSTSQLPPVTLSAGDTIEYFSRAFVLFDSRGHRTTIVLRVAPDDDSDCLVTVDTGEPFPLGMWCRLVSDRAGNKYKPSYALWRTSRTYSLRPGTFNAPTRSTMLRTALQDAVNDAFKSTRRQLRLESKGFASTHDDEGNDDQAAVESGTSTSRTATMQNQMPPSGHMGDRETDESRLCEETTVGGSRNGGVAENGIIPAESIILMSSTSIVPARATESGAPSAELFIQAYPSEGSADDTAGGGIAADVEPLFDPASSTVIPDQTSSANDSSRAVACAEERPCEGIGAEQAKIQPAILTASAAAMTATDADHEAEGLPWPDECKQIVSCLNPKGVLFKDIGEFDKCGCIGDCFLDTCDNVDSAVYCTPEGCRLNAVCSNAPVDQKTLRLFDTGRVGIGLIITTDLEVGDIVGEYAGVLLELDRLREWQPIQAVKQNSGYTMLCNTKSMKNWFMYVEALKFGAVTRFISHACEPNAVFVELQNRSTVKVIVRMIRSVKSGAQITVHYGDETWFKCACDRCWKDENHVQTE